jgi:hypothetical protein
MVPTQQQYGQKMAPTPVQYARIMGVVAPANIAMTCTTRMAPAPALNTFAMGMVAPASEVAVKWPAVSVSEPGAQEQIEMVAETMTTSGSEDKNQGNQRSCYGTPS